MTSARLTQSAAARGLAVDAVGAMRRSTPWIVWLAWASAACGAVCLVARYGFSLPYAEEWAWTPAAMHSHDSFRHWLTMAEERCFCLSKIVYFAVGSLTGFNFRLMAFVNVALLAAAAATLMRTARILRGRTSLTDIFFPLLLLHWAQFINLGWAFQMRHTLLVALICGLIAVVFRCGERLTPVSATLAAALVLAAGLCSPFGVVFLLPTSCWLLLAAWNQHRNESPAAIGPTCWLVTLAMGLAATFSACLAGLISQAVARVDIPVWEIPRTALQALAGGLGAPARESWPVSGLTVTAFVSFGVARLVIQACRSDAQRMRATGALAVIGGVLVTALVLGWRHAGEGSKAGFIQQYTTLIAPLMGCLFLALIVYGPKRQGPMLQKVLLLAMVAMFSINARKGLSYAKEWNARVAPLATSSPVESPPKAAALRRPSGDDISSSTRSHQR